MGQPLKPLEVEITEAVSKRLEIKYVIKGKSLLPAYENGEFQVERSQDEFEWLFTSLTDNPNYVGYLIPPKPPKTGSSLKINSQTRLRHFAKKAALCQKQRHFVKSVTSAIKLNCFAEMTLFLQSAAFSAK